MASSQSSSSIRTKNDPAWEHFSSSTNEKGKTVYTCLYCGSNNQGEGINRMKYHLAGIRGNISSCKKVPCEIQEKMIGYLKSAKHKDQDSNEVQHTQTEDSEAEVEVEELDIPSMPPKQKRKVGINKYVNKNTPPLCQPGIKSALVGKQAVQKAHMAVAKWFFDACIPFNC